MEGKLQELDAEIAALQEDVADIEDRIETMRCDDLEPLLDQLRALEEQRDEIGDPFAAEEATEADAA
jgi:hypothetical protein